MKSNRIISKATALAIVLAMCFTLAACGSASSSAGGGTSASAPSASASLPAADTDNDGVVSVGITANWDGLAPYLSISNYSDMLMEQMYDRLFFVKLDGSWEPRLATDYELAPDSSYVLIHLNENATWHDGEPVTADDVVFTMELESNPEFTNLKRNYFNFFAGMDEGGNHIEGEALGVEAVDEHTVKFTFKEPMGMGPIINVFNMHFSVIPEHIYSQYTAEEMSTADPWMEHMIGSGPFKFDSYIDGLQVEYVRNEDYFLGAPEIQRLIVKVVAASNLYASLTSGDIDAIAGGGLATIPLTDWPAATADPNLTCESIQNYSYQMIFLNINGKLGNQQARQAISTAIDRSVLVDDLFQGEASVVYSPFADFHPAHDPNLQIPAYDPAKAKQMLDDINWDYNQTLEMVVGAGNEIRLQSAVLIQQNLEAIGVKSNIQVYDFAAMMDMMRTSTEFDIGFVGGTGSVDASDAKWALSPLAANNFSQMDDMTLENLFQEAQYAIDPDEQLQVYYELEQAIVDTAYVVYLYSINSLTAYNHTTIGNVDLSTATNINWNIGTWTLV